MRSSVVSPSPLAFGFIWNASTLASVSLSLWLPLKMSYSQAVRPVHHLTSPCLSFLENSTLSLLLYAHPWCWQAKFTPPILRSNPNHGTVRFVQHIGLVPPFATRPHSYSISPHPNVSRSVTPLSCIRHRPRHASTSPGHETHAMLLKMMHRFALRPSDSPTRSPSPLESPASLVRSHLPACEILEPHITPHNTSMIRFCHADSHRSPIPTDPLQLPTPPASRLNTSSPANSMFPVTPPNYKGGSTKIISSAGRT